MAKTNCTYTEGWPTMEPLRDKEAKSLAENLTQNEQVLGQVMGNFHQVAVATDQKLLIIKSGLMAGQSFGGKATSFDYSNISGVEVRSGFSLGEFEVLNPAMSTPQGNRGRDRVKIAETPNGLVFGSREKPHFLAFAAKVREMVGGHNNHQPAAAGPATAPAGIPEQIAQLAKLRDAGVLTDAEFNTKKAELLARM